MPAVLSAILPVLAALFILIAGNGIINTLTPLRANLEGFSQMQIGIIGSAFFTGMLAGTFLAPGIVRRSGHIRAFAAYAAIAAVAVLAMATVVTPWMWAPMRAIIGFAFVPAMTMNLAPHAGQGSLIGFCHSLKSHFTVSSL